MYRPGVRNSGISISEAPAAVDGITGLGPAVAVGQNLLNRNPNSTLATASFARTPGSAHKAIDRSRSLPQRTWIEAVCLTSSFFWAIVPQASAAVKAARKSSGPIRGAKPPGRVSQG